MASAKQHSTDDSIQRELQAVAKLFNACKKIGKIGIDIQVTLKELMAVKQSTESIDATLPSIEEFQDVLKSCLDIADSLCPQMDSLIKKREEGIGGPSDGSPIERGQRTGVVENHITKIATEHDKCLNELKEMAKSGELSSEQAKNLTDSMLRLVECFEKFGVGLGYLIQHIEYLQRVSEKVRGEATKMEERIREEASSTRSEAHWTSIIQWTWRIATLGLVTWRKRFQESVQANNETYERADRLDKDLDKFEKARKLLNSAFQSVKFVAESVKGRPFRLTEDVIHIIRSVIQKYEKLVEAERKIQEKDNTIVQQNEQLDKQGQELEAQKKENEILRRKLEELMRNQGQS